jgi:hypothetical protein
MKTKSIIVSIAILFCSTVTAQETITEKPTLYINPENNCQLRYIYFPNLCAYYDKLELEYIFQIKGEWVAADELPPLYGGYSLFSNVGVELTDFDDEDPQILLKIHKKLYPYNAKGRFSYATATLN